MDDFTSELDRSAAAVWSVVWSFFLRVALPATALYLLGYAWFQAGGYWYFR